MSFVEFHLNFIFEHAKKVTENSFGIMKSSKDEKSPNHETAVK